MKGEIEVDYYETSERLGYSLVSHHLVSTISMITLRPELSSFIIRAATVYYCDIIAVLAEHF